MTNYTILFVSMFEEVFSTIAVGMTEATAGMGAAIAEAMSGESDGGTAAKKQMEKIKSQIGPEVSGQIKQLFSGIRKDVSSKMSESIPESKSYFANPTFDHGIAIVEKYDFALPRFTEKLSDDDLASYLVLLKSGDETLGKMFGELGSWQQSLPKPPGRD
ncbi:MAG: hypothetical protein OK439_04865 [Thaumarchaeota archaeon]|nr:hypothetical protein [Nitrososphaerota archaeon]